MWEEKEELWILIWSQIIWAFFELFELYTTLNWCGGPQWIFYWIIYIVRSCGMLHSWFFCLFSDRRNPLRMLSNAIDFRARTKKMMQSHRPKSADFERLTEKQAATGWYRLSQKLRRLTCVPLWERVGAIPPLGFRYGHQLNSILYSFDFSQSGISVKKCVFNKRTIKVCFSCF